VPRGHNGCLSLLLRTHVLYGLRALETKPAKFFNCIFCFQECKATPWLSQSAFPEMGDSEYPVSLHFRTRDTIRMFRALTEEGLLEVPVPAYVSRALKCARNKVRVRANKDMSVMDQSAH